jgi:plasmid stability protein
MPARHIRNLPDDVHQGLKALAASHGRNTEAEVREILAMAVTPNSQGQLQRPSFACR